VIKAEGGLTLKVHREDEFSSRAVVVTITHPSGMAHELKLQPYDAATLAQDLHDASLPKK